MEVDKMPTYEEVMQALRNADAAGDVEAATRLAQIASQMQQQKHLARAMLLLVLFVTFQSLQ
jgi:predicted helicase